MLMIALQVMLCIFAFMAMLGVLIFIHEFGHFWVARKNGVKVEIFSLGFGPVIFRHIDRHGTLWRISPVPLGGYVKMFGDLDPIIVTGDKRSADAFDAEERKIAYFSKSVKQRSAVVVAGPAVNFIYAILALLLLCASYGQPYVLPLIGEIKSGGVAEQAGLQTGDRVLQSNGRTVRQYGDIFRDNIDNPGAPIVLQIERAGSVQSLTLTPTVREITNHFGQKRSREDYGLRSHLKFNFEQLSLRDSVKAAFGSVAWVVSGTFKGIWKIISGERSLRDLSGIIGLSQIISEVLLYADTPAKALAGLIWLSAIISISLGVMNLLPIPILDGGHLAHFAYESLSGRQLSYRAQMISLKLGMAFMVGLTIYALINDFRRLGLLTSHGRDIFHEGRKIMAKKTVPDYNAAMKG